MATSHSVLVLQREAEERELAAREELAQQLAETARARLELQCTLEEQKRVESALWEHQRFLNSLVSHLPGMVYRRRNDAGRTLLYVSEGSFSLTGYRPSDLEHHRLVSYASLIHPDDAECLWEKCQASLEARIPCSHEYRIINRAGEVRWVWERASGVYGPAGDLQVIEGFITDITERKEADARRRQLEAQLNQAQKLETLGTLAGGIAHDFNNLLAGMIGCIELSQSSLPAGHDADPNLERARVAGLRARELIKRLLLFSRRAPDTVRKPLQLGQLLDETLPIVHASLPASIAIQTLKSNGIGDVLGDYGQLQQVLMNLCLNAGHAIGAKQGHITVDLRPARILPDDGFGCAPGFYACLSVTDDGSGMDEATQAKVFDPFFTTKPEGQGTGLGLALVHGIVHDHGGAIRLRSTPGQGTCFEIYLPAAEGVATSSEPKPPSPGELSGDGFHALVVDDEEAVRMLVSTVLTMTGFKVESASDGLEGAGCFAERPDAFAFALVDLSMPGRNGFELIADMHAIRPGFPVILMSGDHNRYDSPESGHTGDVFIRLAKPFTIVELKAALSAVLDATAKHRARG